MAKGIVIGIDGFDPVIAQRLINQNRLPAFSQLKEKGFFCPLATINPPQSPVVWASIASGVNPGEHGLFDFIHRRPQTYLPYLAISQKNEKNILGLRSALFKPVHSGTPFWQITSANGIPTTVIKWPVSFPPAKVQGKFLSGLGIPDLKNTLGRYTLYTTRQQKLARDLKGEIVVLKRQEQPIKTFIFGPEETKIAVKIFPDQKQKQVRLDLTDGTKIILKEKQWSEWITLNFKQRWGREYQGIAKFLLNSTTPELEIYLSSVHIDPKKPLFPISYPDAYAAELAEAIGDYHTLGLPEETNGLNDEFISLDDFLEFVDNIQHERELMFWQEYNKFNQGLFAFVFDTLDRLQHMFWFTKDGKHPIYDLKRAKKYFSVIAAYYERMDQIIAQLIADKNTLLMIISDHGFSTFRRAVHLNRWLIKEGLMVLKDKAEEGSELFQNVDWSQTRAYAVGFSSIYLNLKGREDKGIVSGGDAPAVLASLKKCLAEFKDKEKNKKIFHQVYFTKNIYHGKFVNQGPEIVVGMRPGYRVSWQTAVGAAPASLIEDNLKQWCGDHLIDASFVPGVFFCNKKIKRKDPTIYDISPTILKHFGIKPLKKREGKSLF